LTKISSIIKNKKSAFKNKAESMFFKENTPEMVSLYKGYINAVKSTDFMEMTKSIEGGISVATEFKVNFTSGEDVTFFIPSQEIVSNISIQNLNKTLKCLNLIVANSESEDFELFKGVNIKQYCDQIKINQNIDLVKESLKKGYHDLAYKILDESSKDSLLKQDPNLLIKVLIRQIKNDKIKDKNKIRIIK
jgi:hypothetical protein